ncbi:MAG TPA: hypothetical protein VMS55_01050, partial [Myxococcota bacterium]|nr:hypothetical protein [Myxococcota bacterium]
MAAWWIWGGALALYAVFLLWYDSWRGPLTKAEIETYMARAAKNSQIAPDRLATVRRFLESDDGREFYMLNLLAVQPEPVADPVTGEKRSAPDVMKRYTDHFLPALFRRAGHPAFVGRAAGGYVEHWGVEENPGWSASGIIRYRSRRDMIELATDPRFEPAHAYKIAALAHTLAFPVAPVPIFVGPRVWIG